MKIIFLGTGTSQGVPTIGCKCDVCMSKNPKDKRLRTSLLVEVEGKTIVIDAGPDFRQQMLRENVQKVDAVLLTHKHKDHVAGLDDIRPYNYLQKSPIEIFADKQTLSTVKQEFAYSFEKSYYKGAPKMNLHKIENKMFTAAGINILPIKVRHEKMEIFGYRIKNFTYITDANYISPEEMKKIEKSKVFVLNALRHEKHPSHFTFSEALEIMHTIKPEQGFLTHSSHNIGLYNEVTKKLPSFVQLAYDGLKIEF